MARNLNKFVLLMWKNWLIQYRHPFQTAIEILAPVLFSALLVLIRSLVEPTDYSTNTHFAPFKITDHVKIFSHVAYSPNSHFVRDVMGEFGKKIGIGVNSLLPFNNSEEMELFLRKNGTMLYTLCGVQFDDDLISAKKFPKNININMRFPGESRSQNIIMNPPQPLPLNWKTNILFPLYQMPGPRNPNLTDGGYPPGYNQEQFLTAQHHLSSVLVRHLTNKTAVPDNVLLQRFPYPPYIDDPLLQALSSFISIVIMLSFVYTSINTVKMITNEKEKQVKEVMKIMGLPNWLHWFAWFIKTFLFVLISVIFIVVLLKVHWFPGTKVSVFTNSDAFVIFTFLCLYMCTTIMFCFMITSFFSKANTAATIAGLFWFLSYTPYLFLQSKYDRLSLFQKIAMSLASNTGMAFGFQFMLMFEGTSEGVQWHTIWKPITPDDTFVLGHVFIMLIIDAIIYLLIALYVEAIFPGEFGMPLPWYFPFTKSYWCGETAVSGKNPSAVEDNYVPKRTSEHYQEPEPLHLQAGIQIKQLRKVFDKKKVAVRNLSLNLYEDQITALLGHNGAGKTTTISMLTGIYPPTSGTAVVAGNDIWTNLSGVRGSLGICTQHNVLFDDLTVKEHLYFFAKLKGLSSRNEVNDDIRKYIQLLDLIPKTDALANTLSGGMKRKLSVGIALCGKSKIVILDEPTAGMDPAARRAMWDLLQVEKKGRTILLTTHFMDEADLLGDRIAIMAGGSLQCCGSSFFLKKHFGTGYHLTLEKGYQCNVMKITELLRNHIPNIEVASNVGSELTYCLNEDQLPVFENMLFDLENNSQQLGIVNYGISLTTLEEVFMKVGADHGQEEQEETTFDGQKLNNPAYIQTMNGTNNDQLEFNRYSSESKLDLSYKLLTGYDLYWNQFRALIKKKFYSNLRAWHLTLMQFIMPVAFIMIAMFVVRNSKDNKDLPPLKIQLSSYDRPITVVESENFSTSFASDYKAFVTDVLDQSIFDASSHQTTVSNYILDMATKNLAAVRLRHIVGASFLNETTTRLWFNNEPYHALPLALNLFYNAILHGNNQSHTINIINRPLPYTMDTKLQQLSGGNNSGFQIAFNIGFGMTFITSFYVIFCVIERVCKSKHLQFVSGVNVFVFWFSAYLYDFLHFTLLCVLLVGTLAAFQEDGFSTPAELGRIFSALLMFGYAVLPLIYLTSFWFKVPSSGYTKLTFISIFTGVAGFLVVQILKTPNLDLKHVADILDWIFMAVPHYGVSSSITNLYAMKVIQDMCDLMTHNYGPLHRMMLCTIRNQCCTSEPNYYSWEEPGIGRNMVYFAVVGFTLFTLLITIEYRIAQKITYALRPDTSSSPITTSTAFTEYNNTHEGINNEDEDVANERNKVKHLSETDIKSYSLVLRDFTKYYGPRTLAVNRLSLGVRQYECFGLLGVNGAGKTSTFKMLTGDEQISAGDAWVSGLSLKRHIKRVHQLIGYCPQFDALLEYLTGRETLTMYCSLRGIPSSDTRVIVEMLASEFNFRRHLDKMVRAYSGGNKRKLSTAVALIGDPIVLYLDEPSTGMDPAAKRHLWSALCRVRDQGKCIVLTSHSMEECEALCTRLAIMVNGTFQCLGSTQHLKCKFSDGYTLSIKLREHTDFESVDRYIRQEFPSAVLREKYQELLTYYIVDTTAKWSKMFGLMEKAKIFLNLEDYSLGQCSLEQVFLSFTKYQKEES